MLIYVLYAPPCKIYASVFYASQILSLYFLLITKRGRKYQYPYFEQNKQLRGRNNQGGELIKGEEELMSAIFIILKIN